MNEVWDEYLCVCVFVQEHSGRGSGGDREEEQRDVGEWFSRWNLICETMHPKETFSHGPTPWIQIRSTTHPAQEGRMHLASTRGGEVQPAFPFSFFQPQRLLWSNHKTQLWWLHDSSYESSIHTSFSAQSVSSYWLSWVFILTKQPFVSMLAEVKCGQRNAAGEFAKGGNVDDNQSALRLLTSGII